jgi:hypothetical protein
VGPNPWTAIPRTRNQIFHFNFNFSEHGVGLEPERQKEAKKRIFYPRPCFADISMWSRGRKLEDKDFFSRYCMCVNASSDIFKDFSCLTYGLLYPRVGSAVVIHTQGSDRKVISSYHSKRQLQLILCYPILTAPISNLLCPNLQFKGGSPRNFTIHNPGMAPCGVASSVHVP